MPEMRTSMTTEPTKFRRARTKIVATIGPASREKETLRSFVGAGVDVFRINTAHEKFDAAAATIQTLRELEESHWPLAILLDLAGPKLRLGSLFKDTLECQQGDTLYFVHGDSSPDEKSLTCTYAGFVESLQIGDRILIADGHVSLEVTARDAKKVECRVNDDGIIRSRQGLNVPGGTLDLPALTEQDLKWIAWSKDKAIDYISLSFVRSANDLNKLRAILREQGSPYPILAKIEKREALACLDDVIEAADAIMVARGDLGLEIDVAQVPVAQKRIVARCNQLYRPVIVATQMLESMLNSSRPTRAETSDIANAILDGADACMLSGETAIGEFPLQAVRTMNRVMVHTEELFRDRPSALRRGSDLADGAHPITRALVSASGQVASRLQAKLVVVATRSGITALIKSNQRDFVPTIAVCKDLSVLRRANLFWGIVPLNGAPCEDRSGLRDWIIQWGRERDLLTSGDRLILISGTQIYPDSHNQLVVYEVP
jgi:pyruvate kinase